MSGHEFEKQVRQKLQNLKMAPSADAWENIEKKLHERKRRPAPVYWLPLLLIGLAAGGYFFIDQLNSDKHLTAKTSSTNTGTGQPGNQKTDIAREDVSHNNPSTTVIVPGNASNEKNIARGIRSGNDGIEPTNNFSPVNDMGIVRNGEAAAQFNIPSEKNAIGKSWYSAADPFNTIFISPASDKQNQQYISKNFTLNNSQGITPKQPSSKKSKGKWSYGVSAFTGISAVNEGTFLNWHARVEDVSSVPLFAPNAQVYKPASISPGFSYSIGAFVKRNLSKKLSLSVGLNYLQMNTRNKVGYEMNGSQVVNNGNRGYLFVYNYYTLEEEKMYEYRNRYHFIEIPVELHTSINKSRKLPMFINAGFSVSQLLESNSLHFDGTTGVYYKNDKLLNQTQAALRAGLSFGVLNKTKTPIWIGPSARYNISKILDKDVSAAKNFMSAGIDMKLFIR